MTVSWEVEKHKERFAIGLDVGQQVDYSALSVVSLKAVPGKFDTESLTFLPEWQLQVRWLERPPLGTPFSEVVRRAVALRNDPALDPSGDPSLGFVPRPPPIVMDATGVGAPLREMFMQHHQVRPVAITITGGATESTTDTGFRLPKIDLVAALSVEFELQRIKIASGLDLSDDLIGELRNFRMEINAATGHTRFDAAPGHHDDLLISVSLAVWWLQRSRRGGVGLMKITFG